MRYLFRNNLSTFSIMSSRSLASARSKRTNETPQRMSGNRPVTSIGSSAAFNHQPPPPQNGRQMNYQQPPPPAAAKSAQPFKRLSISDAIGLITLRLGHLEQWVIDTEHENATNGGDGTRLPDNSKIVDNSVFLSMVERITELEKNKNEVERVNNISRGMTESSKLVKSLVQKYDAFVVETNAKFSDYECAIADLEQQIAAATTAAATTSAATTAAATTVTYNNIDTSIGNDDIVNNENDYLNKDGSSSVNVEYDDISSTDGDNDVSSNGDVVLASVDVASVGITSVGITSVGVASNLKNEIEKEFSKEL